MSGLFQDLKKQLTTNEAHPFVQFMKYAMAGGVATVVDMCIFSILGWKVFPCLRDDELIVRLLDLDIPQLTAAARTWNYTWATSIAFLFSNLTAYITNILWVFKPGRHSRLKEIGLFYAVSIISFFLALALSAALIKWFNAGAALAYVAKMFSSVLINYACRKYFVFKG